MCQPQNIKLSSDYAVGNVTDIGAVERTRLILYYIHQSQRGLRDSERLQAYVFILYHNEFMIEIYDFEEVQWCMYFLYLNLQLIYYKVKHWNTICESKRPGFEATTLFCYGNMI